MPLSILLVVVGLALLVWSADRFIEGTAAVARYAGMPLGAGIDRVGLIRLARQSRPGLR